MKNIILACLLALSATQAAEVLLIWTPAASSTGYRVYKFTQAAGTNRQLIATTTNTQFTVTNLAPGLHRWAVAATNTWGDGPLSNVLATNGAAPPETITLRAPVSLTINITP